MAIEIRMPHLGMIMTEGTLAKWHKNAGEAVNLGEPLAEITTEKITYELEAPNTGLFQPVVQEGEVIPVEGLIAFLLADGEPIPEIPKASSPPIAASPAASAIQSADRHPGRRLRRKEFERRPALEGWLPSLISI